MSKILVARSADLGFIKVVGRGSFQNSGCLKAFYQQLLKEGVSRFVVDLDACTYLDSTFLGILLGLGLKLKEAGNGLLHILNANPRNMELLKNLGLDRLIHIQGNHDPAMSPNRLNGVSSEQLQEMPCPVPTRAEAAPTILEAHENLMEFDPRNIPKFKDVVEFLREDLGQPAGKN
ncbi:MAG TPA: STAS domain-containing protein [Candidatus Methylacidiphilales bacterium]|jgi:anti-anti-sigma factor|nr:STAS domain-containing protein [Candidatus Methylacidiphilales bacterium]